MPYYRVRGGNRICGTTSIGGGKNAALPILAALVLAKGQTILHNVPHIADIHLSIDILRHLGCRAELDNHTLTVTHDGLTQTGLPAELVTKMRSSILFMGAMLGATGQVSIASPGGCQIGPRPIDLHLDGLQKMGATIEDDGTQMHASAPEGLHGTTLYLREISVGATENLLLAAVTAQGKTTIVNAAREPEIVDLAHFLNACGANIRGAGTSTITINGVKTLRGTTYRIMPDRIVTGTYLLAAAMTGGDITLTDVNPADVKPITAPLLAMGCQINEKPATLRLRAPRLLRSLHLTTEAHPGFPTDMQAPFVAALATAKGTSIIEERIFESRAAHAAELLRMGANIRLTTDERTFVIKGRPHLAATDVTARDLRGGAALILAALAATGTTTIHDPGYVARGYDKIEETLTRLGGDVIHFP
ncbi:MAG: UDP-N-acetylglucosamine 1-carboxyvinyltransferase [Defluviitaleaceae bacterium]|nr:UDP-N-acetylglucosamine 1-carboxyvinyltransferase [Defluviitaleaceae bacterium]